MILTIVFLQTFYGETPCIEYEGSNIGPADEQIESYASSARELSARACSCARNARRLIQRNRVSCVRREGIAFQEDLTAMPALKPTTTLEGHISIFKETHSKDRVRKRETGDR